MKHFSTIFFGLIAVLCAVILAWAIMNRPANITTLTSPDVNVSVDACCPTCEQPIARGNTYILPTFLEETVIPIMTKATRKPKSNDNPEPSLVPTEATPVPTQITPDPTQVTPNPTQVTPDPTQVTPDPTKPPCPTKTPKPTKTIKPPCNNGEGNGGEGCSPSDNGNNDED